MDPETLALISIADKPKRSPSKPTAHGCAYFDPGCPWNICFACEYEKDPEAYENQIRKAELTAIITAYWRDVNRGAFAHSLDVVVLEGVVEELSKPRDKRTFTDAQLGDFTFKSSSPVFKALRSLVHMG